MRVALNSTASGKQQLPNVLRMNSTASVMNDDSSNPGVIFLGGSGQTTQTTSSRVIYVPTPSTATNSSPMPTIINASGNNNFLMNLFLTAVGLVALAAGGRFAWKFAGEVGIRDESADSIIKSLKKYIKDKTGIEKASDIINKPTDRLVEMLANSLDENAPIASNALTQDKVSDFQDADTPKPSSLVNEMLHIVKGSDHNPVDLSKQIQNELTRKGLDHSKEFVTKLFALYFDEKPKYFVLGKVYKTGALSDVQEELNGLEHEVTVYRRRRAKEKLPFDVESLEEFLKKRIPSQYSDDLKIIFIDLDPPKEE